MGLPCQSYQLHLALSEIASLVFCATFSDIDTARLVMLIRCLVLLVNDEKCIVYR